MARTYRRYPAHWLRRPRTTNSRRGEHATVKDMLQEGINVRNRFRARGNPTSSKIPDAWDDMIVSALSEGINDLKRCSRWEWSRKFRANKKGVIHMYKGWLSWGCCYFENERGSGRNI